MIAGPPRPRESEPHREPLPPAEPNLGLPRAAVMSPADLRDRIRERARALGFDRVRFTGPHASGHMDFYRRWIEEGAHGEMGYLAREDSIARRGDLRLTMADVRSVVLVTHNYHQPDPPGLTEDGERAVIARYARGDDYHDVMKRRLVKLLADVEGDAGRRVSGRAYVDTGPILERELAMRAGLGWLGKNTMLIDPGSGSYFFLGILLLDLELPEDEPFTEDRCGTCRSCLDACPTGALLGRDARGAPVMDARRCISYLTIEHRGPIPRELRAPIGNRIYGCDICQEVCPWNVKFRTTASEPAYRARPELDGPSAGGAGRAPPRHGRCRVLAGLPRLSRQAGEAQRPAAQRLRGAREPGRRGCGSRADPGASGTGLRWCAAMPHGGSGESRRQPMRQPR